MPNRIKNSTPPTLGEITGIKHKFKNVISSTVNIHIRKNKCLEIVAVKGSTREVRSLTQELMVKKDVKQVKVAIAP